MDQVAQLNLHQFLCQLIPFLQLFCSKTPSILQPRLGTRILILPPNYIPSQGFYPATTMHLGFLLALPQPLAKPS